MNNKELKSFFDFRFSKFDFIKFFVILIILVMPLKTFAYSDVPSDYSYKTAVDYITEKGIVGGYADGTYKPDSKINRAEFTKIIVQAKLGKEPTESASDCFPDVTKDQWFASYVCYAKDNGFIGGYPDGNFKPADNINLVEASKILVNVLSIPTKESVGKEWYSEYIEAMADFKYIPPSFSYPAQPVTRGEMAEMIWRILEKKSDQQSVTADKLANPCYPLGENIPSNIDMARVRSTWLGWYNGVRSADGLAAYKYNEQLNRTAIAWSEQAKAKGTIEHKRNPGDSYYDYTKIMNWFKNLGLEFKNIYGVTFTENIGWGPYRCSKADCTDDLISAVRTTFDFFMGEKGKAYTAHYDSVMNKYFKEIGLGIAIDENARKYYLTVHYDIEITSNPWPICE